VATTPSYIFLPELFAKIRKKDWVEDKILFPFSTTWERLHKVDDFLSALHHHHSLHRSNEMLEKKLF